MKKKYFFIGLAVVLILFLIWYFRDIITYIVISIVLSLIGQPIAKKLDEIKIGKFKLPHTFNTLIALLVIITGILFFIGVFIPIISNQAKIISSMDAESFQNSLKDPIKIIEGYLIDYEIIDKGATIEEMVTSKFMNLLNMTNFSEIMNYLLTFTGNVFIGIFAILFITFFFIKDEKLFTNFIDTLTPTKHQQAVRHILKESKRLLTRYFLGIITQISIVVTLLTIGVMLVGAKNALIIGFFGGIMNVIPYLGPVIGTIIGLLLGVTGNLGGDFYTDIIPLMIKIAGVFVVVNLIDNIVLQPTIFSNSVKAHPLEIFLVIMIAGGVAGIPGMILAIPAYTFLRIVAKEFFNKFKVVKSLTKEI